MDNLLRIQKASKRFRIFFTFIMIITPIIPITALMLSNHLPDYIRTEIFKGVSVPFRGELPMTTRLLASGASLIPSIIIIIGLYYLTRLFKLYEKGIIFMSENVACFKKMGYLLIISMFGGIINNSLMSMILTLNNPPGQRMLSIGFTSNDLTKIIIGCLIILVSWIMDIGREIQEEQKYTV